IAGQPVSRATLRQIAEVSPYPSLVLAGPLAQVMQRLADDAADDSERARWLVELSNRLGDLGRREEALAAAEQALAIGRQLARDQPEVFLPALAAALNNQSSRLANLGRPEEALAAADQALSIRRDLARDCPDVFLPELAKSLNNQSTYL